MSEEKNTPQEIDLIEIFKNLYEWIIKWSKIIFFGVLYFFLRNAHFFVICIIIGASLNIVEKKIVKKYYKSDLIGYSHTINNIEVIQFINNWNYANEFEDSLVAKIKNIKGTYLLDKNKDGIWDEIENSESNVPEDSILNKRLYGNFCIQIQVYDTTIISKITPKLFKYMASNKRVKELNEIRIKQQQELLVKVKKEISDLDSLKNTQYFKKQAEKNDKNGSLLIWNEKETRLYHSDILALYNQEQGIERDLFLNKDPFEIIQDFSSPVLTTKESSVKNKKPLMKYTLVLGFALILMYDQRRYIKKLYKQSNEASKQKA